MGIGSATIMRAAIVHSGHNNQCAMVAKLAVFYCARARSTEILRPYDARSNHQYPLQHIGGVHDRNYTWPGCSRYLSYSRARVIYIARYYYPPIGTNDTACVGAPGRKNR